jgi:hypothetical protein
MHQVFPLDVSDARLHYLPPHQHFEPQPVLWSSVKVPQFNGLSCCPLPVTRRRDPCDRVVRFNPTTRTME